MLLNLSAVRGDKGILCLCTFGRSERTNRILKFRKRIWLGVRCTWIDQRTNNIKHQLKIKKIKTTYQYSNSTISWVGKCHVCRIRWTSSASVIDIISVYHYLFNLSILTKEIKASKCWFLSYVRCQSYNIY